MISPEQLQDWEQRSDTKEFAEMECHEVVPQLIAEVRALKGSLVRETKHLAFSINDRVKMQNRIDRLEREADWLAEKLNTTGECPESLWDIDLHCSERCTSDKPDIECWRLAAKKAVPS